MHAVSGGPLGDVVDPLTGVRSVEHGESSCHELHLWGCDSVTGGVAEAEHQAKVRQEVDQAQQPFAPSFDVVSLGHSYLAADAEIPRHGVPVHSPLPRTHLAELGSAEKGNATAIVGNVEAMKAAISLADRLDADAILRMHAALMRDYPEEEPGAWRTEQVWIGGDSISPHAATFVPPHHSRVVLAKPRSTDSRRLSGGCADAVGSGTQARVGD